MSRYAAALVSLWVCCSALPCAAQRTTSADKPIHVKLEVEQPTSLAFPEVLDKIQYMGFGDKPEDQRISVDSRGPYAYLTLRDETYSGRLFILGQSGKQYTVFFKAGTPADVVVHIRATPAATPATQAIPVDVPAVLRALWTQVPLPGQEETDLTPPAIPDARITLTHSHAFTLGGYLGLVVQIRNTSDRILALDVRTEASETIPEDTVTLAAWVWPPRLTIEAIAAEKEVLAIGDEARLYIVLKRRG